MPDLARRALLLAILLVFVTSSTGCMIKHLPTPPTPERRLPVLATAPPPAVDGMGQVAIDTVDGPARVEAIVAEETWSGTYTTGTSTRTVPVCTSPCVANLPYGAVKLSFVDLRDPGHNSTDMITVGAQPSVYRHQIGDNTRHMGRAVLGMLLDIGGGVTGLVGLGLMAGGDSIGTGMAIGGAIALAVGLLVGRHTLIEQSGAGVQWTPDDGVVSTR
jgi:hypothetical protein